MKLWPFAKNRIALSVPGPSPWYLRAPLAVLETSEGVWKWAFYEGPTLAGLARLLSPEGATVLFLDFHCYVQALTEDRILIWYEIGGDEKNSETNRVIVFTLLYLPMLQAFDSPEFTANEMRQRKNARVRFQDGGAERFVFPTTVEGGEHPLSAPASFAGLDEQLVLSDFGHNEPSHFDKMYRAIFAFNFKHKKVSVYPQQWFNEGSYDFGYQWITRVQRDPKTDLIVGEGIRLGTFRLDSTAMKIKEWLHKDAFYHPER